MSKLLTIFISIACISVFSVMFVVPRYGQVADLKGRLSEKQDELLWKQAYFSQLKNFSKRLKEYPEEIKKVETSLPFNLDTPLFLEFLQQISAENGVIIQNISITSPKQTYQPQSVSSTGPELNKNISVKNIKQKVVGLEISGTLENFLKFLVKLEKSARIVKIGSISFDSPQAGSPLDNLGTESENFLFNVSMSIRSWQD